MATALPSPYIARDPVRLRDAVEELKQSGHAMSLSTLERESRARGITIVKRGRANYASWTDLLDVHAAWVDARDALS